MNSNGYPVGDVSLCGVRPVGGAAVDVSIAGGRIAAIGSPGAGRRIDCAGLIMLPAFVDLHTHLREPGGEDAETIASGTRAAAAGGYGDVFAMANCAPVTDTPGRIRHVAGIAARTASCRVHPVGAITVGLAGYALAAIGEMARAGARMVSDDGRCVEDAAVLRTALLEAKRAGVPVAQHAQCGRLAGDGQINAGLAAERTGLAPWPGVAEESIVARDAVLAGETGSHLHVCHVSTAGTVDVVRWAKQRGWRVTAEVTPHHLLLDDGPAISADPIYKVNPPLRTSADVTALRAGLRDGTIDAVATDHAPHTAEAKSAPWACAPFGMTGLETALAVVAGVLSDGTSPDWHLVAAVMSHNPARIGGVDTSAGRPLAVGEPATFALVDPDADWLVDPSERVGKSFNTPMRGMRFRSRVIATILDGIVRADPTMIFAANGAA